MNTTGMNNTGIFEGYRSIEIVPLAVFNMHNRQFIVYQKKTNLLFLVNVEGLQTKKSMMIIK